MRVAIIIVAIVAGPAQADDRAIFAGSTAGEPRAYGTWRATSEPESKHLIYVEALGKAGPYGVGYEFTITPRLALGIVGSYAIIRDQHLATGAPYLHATLLRRRKHALFGELGLVFVHSRIPSPVASWDGMAESGAGGVGALGWERKGRRLVMRAQGSVLVGEGGAAPWLGLAIGWRP